jgi:hypothetical protein
MITIKTMRQVATCRTIPSFRSCRLPGDRHYQIVGDRGRVVAARCHVLAWEHYRQWRNRPWIYGN